MNFPFNKACITWFDGESICKIVQSLQNTSFKKKLHNLGREIINSVLLELSMFSYPFFDPHLNTFVTIFSSLFPTGLLIIRTITNIVFLWLNEFKTSMHCYNFYLRLKVVFLLLHAYALTNFDIETFISTIRKRN